MLEVKDLKTHFFTEEGVVKAVDGVSFSLEPESTLAIVGESGSGKSVTALSILKLVPQPPGKIVGGEIIFKDKDLLKLKDSEMRQIRGGKIAMVFQEPFTSLNPVFNVGTQIMETIVLHQKESFEKALTRTKEAYQKAVELLEMVGIPKAKERVYSYPHEFSGGMRQRVMIAMALSCQPEILIADEPTTALDVTIEAQILELLQKIKEQKRTSIILITHNLGIVAEVADKVAVMYAGRIVEYADVETVFYQAKHPYTLGLLNSITRLDEVEKKFKPIRGMPPSLVNLPQGCSFNPRCDESKEVCCKEGPVLKDIGKGHLVACHQWGQLQRGQTLHGV